MKKQDPRELASAFARKLAAQRIDSKALTQLAESVVGATELPVDINICTHGICLDYWVKRDSLGELINSLEQVASLDGLRIFTKGIINPDIFMVQVEHIMER